jgi:MoaA/NifB/PqqE/SkfB family radical SAM enzyme
VSSPTPNIKSFATGLWARLEETGTLERLEGLTGWRLAESKVESGRLDLRFDSPAGEPLTLRAVPHRDGQPALASGAVYDVLVPGELHDVAARTFVELAVPYLIAAGEENALPAGAKTKKKSLPLAPSGPPKRAGKSERLELFLSDHCNIACAFCWESERNARHRFMPWEDVTRHIDAAAARGVELVEWLGGEASAHPRFLEALAYAREKGLRNYLITNLLAFSSERFARDACDYLDEIMVSMHAWGEEGGLRVVQRKGWWPAFQRGLVNLKAHFRGGVRVSTVLTRYNVDDLEKIADALLDLRPRAWVFGNPVPSGDGKSRFSELSLTLDEQRALVPRIQALRARCEAVGAQLMLFCFPHCVVGPDLWDITHDRFMDEMDLDLDDRWDEDVHVWPRAETITEIQPIRLARVRPPVCAPCERRKVCGGYFVTYLRERGVSELRPR